MKAKKRKLLILFLIPILLLALIADSNLRITVTEYELSSPAIPESFSGYRIAQLSDIHGKTFSGRLAEKTAELSPDIIVITGDLADRDSDMERIAGLLRELCDIAPVYYVSGNHEWGDGVIARTRELLSDCGCTYLSNEYVRIFSGESSILLAGVEDPNSLHDMPTPDKVVEKMRAEAEDDFCILLGHRNYWAEEYPELDVDAILCGHAHGGIVRLPFLGGVLGTGFRLFPDYVSGRYSLDEYELFISRGLGNSIGIPRFLNNPEIVLLTLACE